MTTVTRTLRRSLKSRGMKFLIALVLLLGAIMLYLLSSASACLLYTSDAADE